MKLASLALGAALVLGGARAGAQEVAPKQTSEPLAMRYERRSTPMMVAGMVTTGTGLAAMGVGVGLLAGAESRDTSCGYPLPSATKDADGCAGSAAGGVGYAMILLGMVTSLVGIPLWLSGGEAVPAKPAAVPTVAIRPSGGALRWRF